MELLRAGDGAVAEGGVFWRASRTQRPGARLGWLDLRPACVLCISFSLFVIARACVEAGQHACEPEQACRVCGAFRSLLPCIAL